MESPALIFIKDSDVAEAADLKFKSSAVEKPNVISSATGGPTGTASAFTLIVEIKGTAAAVANNKEYVTNLFLIVFVLFVFLILVIFD